MWSDSNYQTHLILYIPSNEECIWHDIMDKELLFLKGTMVGMALCVKGKGPQHARYWARVNLRTTKALALLLLFSLQWLVLPKYHWPRPEVDHG